MKRLIVLVFAVLFLFYVGWPAFSGYQIHQALEAKDSGTLEQKIDFPSVRTSMREPVLGYVEERMGKVIKSFGPLAELFGTSIPTKKIARYVDAALEEVVNPDSLGRIYAEGGDISVELQRAIMNQINKSGGVLAFFKRSGKGGSKSAKRGGGGGSALPGGIELPGGVGDLVGGGAGAGLLANVLSKIDGLDAAKVAKKLFPKLSKDKKRSASKSSGEESSFGLGNLKSFGFAGPLGMEVGVAGSSDAKAADVTAQIMFENFDWRVKKLTPNL